MSEFFRKQGVPDACFALRQEGAAFSSDDPDSTIAVGALFARGRHDVFIGYPQRCDRRGQAGSATFVRLA